MGLRVMWSSNALHVRTGYGVQARYVLPGLVRHGHECAQFAWYGIQGGLVQAGDIVMYPRFQDPYGSDIISDHVAHFKADCVISLQDIWVLPEDYRKRCGVPWMPWFPVDATPVPPRVLKLARTADYPVVYSQFGYEEMRKAGVDTTYIPHGVNTDVYKPLDRVACKRKFGWDEDIFVAAMVAANKGLPSRKGFPEALQMFKHFHDRHPNSVLYLHTLATPEQSGVDFRLLMDSIDGFPHDAVNFCSQYPYKNGMFEESYLAQIYNAADVLLVPSYNEGFGIPIIEAQACGTPVLTNKCTSMPELTFAGQSIEPLQQWWIPLGAWVGVPNIDAFVEGLEWAYRERGNEQLRRHARASVMQFDWQRVIDEHWAPFLAKVEREIKGASVGVEVG
jgi:glycosyltransferase involved in cell wall biosynthesis